MLEWSDLRYFLSVARTGSTVAAARELGVNQSTVQRRIAALELQLGRKLVQRHHAGYRLTALAHELLPCAREVEQAVAAFERRLASSEEGPFGTIRLTCPEPLVDGFVAPLVARFNAAYPDIRIDLIVDERFLDLCRGEADVAVRGGLPHEGELIARKISDNPWAIYASRSYIARHGRPACAEDINRHSIVDFGEGIGHLHLAKWLRSVAPRAAVAARSNTVVGLQMASKSGVGLALLPVQLGDPESELVRVLDPLPELMSSVYLLVHPDMRRAPRIRAFIEFVFAEAASFEPLLRGLTRSPA